MTKTVLILGASGSFGSNCAKEFAAAGWDVRKFQRGVDDMNAKAKGCDVIVNGLNPQGYKNWPTELPKIISQVIGAAKSSGATILQPGNIYNYGDTSGVLTADTPQNATTRKGKARIDMEASLQRASGNGVQVIILRAGDFIDKTASGNYIDHLVGKLNKGNFTYPGNINIPHAWAYLPDMARAAVMLAEMRGSLSNFEDIPFEGHALSGQEINTMLAKATGVHVKTVKFPWFMMRLLSPFWGMARELREIRYLWDMPHSVSGRRMAELLPDFKVTDKQEIFNVVARY